MSDNLPYEELFKSANSAARHYWSLGLDPIPFSFYQENSLVSRKTPFKWTPEEIDRNFGADDNVALALGERSGNLIDIDFHWWEAAEMAFDLLEGLPIFGRRSSQICHRLARGKLPRGLVQFRIPDMASHLFDADSSVVLELKGDGRQTMVPPSVHPSGEIIKWWPECCAPENADRIPDVDVRQLIEDAGLFAALAVITRAHSKAPSNRNDIYITIAGTLLRLGWPTYLADDFVEKVACNAGDDDWSARGHIADTTLARLKAGANIGGISALCDLLGIEPMADTLREWLGVSDGNNDGDGGNAVTVSNSNCLPRTLDGPATPVRFSEGDCDE